MISLFPFGLFLCLISHLQICPGIPVWQTDAGSKFPKIPYVIFPGNVGDAGTLQQAVKILSTV